MNPQQAYTDWKQTPLKWHRFVSYVGLPLGILFNLAKLPSYFDTIELLRGTEYAWLSWFDLAYALILLLTAILALIGMIRKRWLGPGCYIGCYVISSIYLAVYLCLNPIYGFSNVPSTLARLVVNIVFSFLFRSYYMKRRFLFTRGIFNIESV